MTHQNSNTATPFHRRTLFALLAAASMFGANASMADSFETGGYYKMTGQEIHKALVGNSLDGTDRDGDYVIHYKNTSKMRIQYQGRKEAGVWRIKGNQYCRRWQSFGKGQERCVNFYRKGDRINWVQNGKITDRAILIRGNPAKL